MVHVERGVVCEHQQVDQHEAQNISETDTTLGGISSLLNSDSHIRSAEGEPIRNELYGKNLIILKNLSSREKSLTKTS